MVAIDELEDDSSLGETLAKNDHHRDGPSSDFRPTPKLENFISMVGTLVSYNTSPQRKVHPRIRWNDRLNLVHLTCSGWFGSSSSASISSSISWFGCHNITPALIPWNKVNWGSVRIGNMLHGSTWQKFNMQSKQYHVIHIQVQHLQRDNAYGKMMENRPSIRCPAPTTIGADSCPRPTCGEVCYGKISIFGHMTYFFGPWLP